MQHFNHVTPSFSYRIEHCYNPSKFLVREKTRARTYDTRTNILYQDSRTSFLYKKLGSSAISIRQDKVVSISSGAGGSNCSQCYLMLMIFA